MSQSIVQTLHKLEVLHERSSALANQLASNKEDLRAWLQSIWSTLFTSPIKIKFNTYDDDYDDEDGVIYCITDGVIRYWIHVGDDGESFAHSPSDLTTNLESTKVLVRNDFGYLSDKIFTN